MTNKPDRVAAMANAVAAAAWNGGENTWIANLSRAFIEVSEELATTAAWGHGGWDRAEELAAENERLRAALHSVQELACAGRHVRSADLKQLTGLRVDEGEK